MNDPFAPTIHPRFGNHAAMQGNRPIRPWGTGRPGNSMEADFQDVVAHTRVASDGGRLTVIPGFSEAGPHARRVRIGDAEIEHRALVLGEVWLGSGQPNMVWPLSFAKDSAAALDKSGWATMEMPEFWQDRGLALNGSVWFCGYASRNSPAESLRSYAGLPALTFMAQAPNAPACEPPTRP